METQTKLSDLVLSQVEELKSVDETNPQLLKKHLSFAIECMSFMAQRIEKNEEDIKYLSSNIEELANASTRIVQLINNIR
jgi:hypothetical protein